VSFVGNTFFSDGELRQRIRMLPNRRFLGLPGFTWWRWVYQLGDSGILGRRIGNAFKSGGEPPAYLDSTTVERDVERLEIFYEQQGFRQANVTATVESTEARDRVRLAYRISAGPPTYLRRVTYDGLEQLTARQKERLARGSNLELVRSEGGDSLHFRVAAQRYTKPLLLEERQRLLAFLRNEGYARIARDSIRALVYQPAADSFDVTFRVQTGGAYRFGDVQFRVLGLEEGAQTIIDTLNVASAETASGWGPVVTARVEQDRRLRSSLLRRSLQFEPGAPYNRDDLLATKRRLESTGIFTFTNILPQADDTVHTSSGTELFLPHRIELRTRPRHRIRAQTFMLQRSGVLGGENEIGTGIGLTYENANLLGGGETFRLGTSGSIAADFDSTLFSSAQAEVTTSLTSPYLIRPFSGLDDALNLYDARTRISLSLLTARRDQLRLNIRGRGTARLQLEMQHTPTITSLVDVFDLSLSNPDPQEGFRELFLDRVIGPDDDPIITDPVQRQQIIEDYTEPQINTALRYTFRSSNTNPLRRERGYSYEASGEVGNTLPYLLDRFVTSPDTLENSIPGLPFLRASESSRLVYRPYVRFVGDLRRYRPLSRGTVLATKLLGGVAHPIGRPDVVPFDRRFYAGGASSVRGWGLRELGPGRSVLDTTSTTQTANVLGGDIKLEGSIELRTTLLRDVLAANWMGAAFVDAGNVWFGPRNPGNQAGRFEFDDFLSEIGVGTGVGVRFVWSYLIVRLDLAYRVHDPVPQQQGLFPDGLRRPQLHFGIGHAF
jgi:outer membrane translocation and assembly module TamA